MRRTFVLLFSTAVIFGYWTGLRGEEAEPPKGWTSSVGLGFTATSGNSEITNLALTFQAVKEMTRAKWSTNANVALATTEGDETANNGGVKTQYDIFQTDRLFYFGKFGAEYDKFAELDLRTSPGAGVGYILVKDEKSTLSASLGANVVTDFFSDDTDETRGTLSTFEEWSYQLSPNASLYQNFNIQNNFEEFDDYLINAELSLSTKVSDQLTLKASLLDKYDSKPFSDALKNNDLTFITSLNYSL
jgi:putative salt-induced outer membrane protein YdiY